MKIGFDSIPATFPGTYCQHLVKILAKYAPEHEYVVDDEGARAADIYHSFTTPVSQGFRLRGYRRVVTVRDLNFLHFPQMFTLFDRLVRIRLYKHSCRSASCVIALNRRTGEELAEQWGIDRRKIEVMLPLGAHPPVAEAAKERFEAVRAKYSLPQRYILAVGLPEERRNLLEIFDALRDSDPDCALVACGRRTAYSDFLLRYARAAKRSERIEFIYEPSLTDLPVLFRMAEAFVSVPDAGAETSLLPVVEAIRSGIPVVLSDTSVHREAAADAAIYVPEDDKMRLASALRSVLSEDALRRRLAERARVRADHFSETAVVRRLMDIYSSL